MDGGCAYLPYTGLGAHVSRASNYLWGDDMKIYIAL